MAALFKGSLTPEKESLTPEKVDEILKILFSKFSSEVFSFKKILDLAKSYDDCERF